MKKQQFGKLRTQTLDQLVKLLEEETSKLVQLRLEKLVGKLKNPRQVFFQRKKLAQIKTLIKEKQLAVKANN